MELKAKVISKVIEEHGVMEGGEEVTKTRANVAMGIGEQDNGGVSGHFHLNGLTAEQAKEFKRGTFVVVTTEGAL